MNNLEKYNKAFTDVFDEEESVIMINFSFNKVEKWDSVAHMNLIVAIEDAFEIMMDTDDILNFISYEAGKEILAKYDIVI